MEQEWRSLIRIGLTKEIAFQLARLNHSKRILGLLSYYYNKSHGYLGHRKIGYSAFFFLDF